MTSPLSPEAVAQMVADREAGTPGPWHFDGPVWNQIIWTDGENRLCFMAHSNGLNDDRDIANARRIASLPDIEAAYLTLVAENATLRSENDIWTERATDAELNWANCTRLAQRLRASEAAALERVKVLTEALAKAQYGLSWAKANLRDFNVQGAPVNDGLIATGRALTPTADKEPTT